ncbi:hypothetical protein [Paraburkholderia nodosa]|uniref:hypothetical protein n=1 Tax=Paraburkholderia nodosa TaxID=392320 RepID=UPI00114D1647|nr:hypothetical protein [Paraburkholderia nodosa]
MRRTAVSIECQACCAYGDEMLVGTSVVSSMGLEIDQRYWPNCIHREQQHSTRHQWAFELSFNAGLYELQDEDFQSAVSYFSLSLQHSYEFYLRAAAYQDGINKERFDTAWRILSDRPDLQFEAYVIYYRAAFGFAPDQLSDVHRVMRQTIAEDTVVLTRAEVVSLAQLVLNALQLATADARHAFPEGFQRVKDEHTTEAIPRV